MPQCKNITHPFRNDPGTSQRQRVMAALDADAPEIDGRTLADLLDYFTRLSQYINYYDKDLQVSDWQPFFNKSIPFNLASISRYDIQSVDQKLALYKSLFQKRPGTNTLQLVAHYMYYSTIHRINSWHGAVKGSGLPFEYLLQNLVTDRLLEPVRSFISLVNAAVREHCIAGINFSVLAQNEIWDLSPADLLQVNKDARPVRGRRRRMEGLLNAFTALWPAFTEAIKLLGTAAENSISDSLVQQKDELKQQHAPHLALLFAFLQLFGRLQGDLNSFTRKHLDLFFKEVLRLIPRAAQPDQAHVVFEIQKQLDSYLLKKGLLVKDGKDKNKQEILFALDEEIVVNKAQVAAVKTLFLHTRPAQDDVKFRLLEGVYMAPVADKADGLAKEFKDGEPVNWPTLGSRYSKFTDTGETKPALYPYARIGFVLASPVLLLNEGVRTVTVQLLCSVQPNCTVTPIINDAALFARLAAAMGETYFIISKKLIALAEKKGVEKTTIDALNALLPEVAGNNCFDDGEVQREDNVQLTQAEWNSLFFSAIQASQPAEAAILQDIFTGHRAFKIAFSGKSSWIEPSSIDTLSITPAGGDYLITIKVTLQADKPAVTWFNPTPLKEELATKLPVVKIELDTEIRLGYEPGDNPRSCCFENCVSPETQPVALYQFFRDLRIIKGTDQTRIDVAVCGVKNLLVRNDENLLDVNGPMAALGVRPEVGSSFYIGSKEIFSKNWQEIYINTEWKDRPVDLAQHYEHYFYEVFEDGSNQITNNSFKLKASLLEDGDWLPDGQKNLFQSPSEPRAPFCNHTAPLWNQNVYHYARAAFPGSAYQSGPADTTELAPLNVNSVYGFLKLTLEGVGFQHDRYPFVLARHMMALAGLVDPVSLNAAIVHLTTVEDLANAIHNRVTAIQASLNSLHSDIGSALLPGPNSVFVQIGQLNAAIANAVIAVNASNTPAALGHLATAAGLATQIIANLGAPGVPNSIIGEIGAIDSGINADPDNDPATADLALGGIHELIIVMQARITDIKTLLKVDQALKNGLPKEPYTPLAKDLSLDYTAVALIDDIALVHLYPYDNTHKEEAITLQPALLPVHCNEGTLFIGLKQLVPGSNINLLFQLAEATADSEASRALISWHYLANNEWLPLRNGFEVLDDATKGLTTSGIIRLSLPANTTTGNTILPKELHWIKASAARNVIAVSETTGIHTQAVKASFVNTPDHDQLRLADPLEASKLSKLNEADANVKKVVQPYVSFGGAIPEAEGNYYTRVSEWLRHKGRAIQKFDYERLVLDAFPAIYKVKCINHSFKLPAQQYRVDVNAAPGYVIVAVIPDLNRLQSGRSFEPKAPLSLLEKIRDYLRARTSPFARLEVVNPRYEKIDICIKVQLVKGKDKVFYRKQLETDLRLFLAPWAVGETDKLSFGQCINRSDIVRFIESRDYVDYIICLRLLFEKDCETGKTTEVNEVCPLTPRSILVGGNIDVCIPEADCEQWGGADECSKRYSVTEPECRQQEPIR